MQPLPGGVLCRVTGAGVGWGTRPGRLPYFILSLIVQEHLKDTRASGAQPWEHVHASMGIYMRVQERTCACALRPVTIKSHRRFVSFSQKAILCPLNSPISRILRECIPMHWLDATAFDLKYHGDGPHRWTAFGLSAAPRLR